MGGFLHLFDFNQGNMARKILAQKLLPDGLEAPRNSLELQVEASEDCCAAGDGMYSFHIEEDWSENKCYEASMKKLINEEISKKPTTKTNAPSIVARLMGVDMLPLDTKSVVHPIDRKDDNTATKSQKKEKYERSPVTRISRKSYSATQMELDSFYCSKEADADRWDNMPKPGKPRPREHPQEEELQKFKKEFEAWQAARFNECSKFVEFGDNPCPMIGQENIKQNVALKSSYLPTVERHIENKGLAPKATSREQRSLQHDRHKPESFLAEKKESFSSRTRTRSRNPEHSLVNCDQKLDTHAAAPTRIVILKPGPDRIYDHEECWTSSSDTLEDRGSIEDFLEEVKERLRRELQGKTLKRGSVVRGRGIETPFSEKPSDPKQIAQHIAKHVRENVTRDLGMNLLCSESTRSYKSDVQINGLGSPEFINRDTRRFLSDRLRNVLKRESHVEVPTISRASSGSHWLDDEKVGLNQVAKNSRAGNDPSYWEIVKDEQEMQTGSFRHGGDDGPLHKEPSPRNLIRSLSAPVSGTSFGKLLLEDRHILTGAQIRRKHEAAENVIIELKKNKKEKLNIKERVSSFRYSFTLRGKLFGKKIQSMMESHRAEQHLLKDIMNGPTALLNLGERHIMENSTEVPPSPASVCSSAQEEFWRPSDYLSYASTPDISMEDDKAMPQVFREISSNLSELRRQLNQLEYDELSVATTEQEPMEFILDDNLEDKAEVYVRDLLVASGLYHGSSDKNLLHWNTLAQPISVSVFDKVEESSRKLAKDSESAMRNHDEKKVERKMLFDLLNEALSTLLGPPMVKSIFSRKVSASLMPSHLCGRKLLEFVWEIICRHLYPATDKSCDLLDNMVAGNLGSVPWSGLIEGDINELGKEIERRITEDIIEEIVKDMHQ